MKTEAWIKLNKDEYDILPELVDGSVLAHFENGSIETVHIQDYFGFITNGLNEDGSQKYTQWYLNNFITHWMPLPEPPKI